MKRTMIPASVNVQERITSREAHWYRVLQLALHELGVQSLARAAEVGRFDLQDALELRREIDNWIPMESGKYKPRMRPQ